MLISSVEPVSANIPIEYKPNYKFSNERNKIEDIKNKIAGITKNGGAVDTAYFSELLKNFNVLFNHLPQNKSEYKVVYETCLYGAQELSQEYKLTLFWQFRTNCLVQLENIYNDIQSNSSVKANIKVNPAEGSAPLTVTFDGRGSIDDTATIPSNGYYWYFTDTDKVEKVIGQGPTVNYKFEKEWRYLVNLTVRSVNEWFKGVFDGSATAVVNVGPQAANIFVFANGRRMNEETALKFTSQEATDGIILDGSATTPLWWRVIQRHGWKIVAPDINQTIFETSASGTPGYIRQKFTSKGLYNVTLSTVDNENNLVSKTYSIIIADPIAAIRITPEDGNTSAVYSFDASTSYSVQSSIKSYLWIITDSEWEEVARERTKTIQHKFVKPWTYRVRLQVTDQIGNENEDYVTLDVWSTPPVPQFTVTPTRERLNPSEYRLDASASYDVDSQNGGWDFLTYSWSFSNNDNVSIVETADWGKRIKISFKEKWEYKAVLTVKDNYWKIEQTERAISVKSALRPIVYANPIATKLWTDTTFRVQANKPIVNYSWNLGDGETRITQTPTLVHRYKRVWSYKVTLVASTADGESNQISLTVFVWEANAPIPVHTVTTQRGWYMIPDETCIDEKGQKVDAYEVDRYESINIDGSKSVNVKGLFDSLFVYFNPQWENIHRGTQLSYKFDELWCRFVDMNIEDTSVNKVSSKRIWFFVKNAEPELDNLLMTFPQAWNTYWIGIWQNAADDNAFQADVDPIAVRLEAVNARDSDGSITTYRWYYYNIDDPDRLLEIKYTSTPYVYFSVYRIPWEYRFAVELTDNDNVRVNSETFLWNGPVVFFPPSSKKPDIPMVTLKIDKVNAKVGDIITLETTSRVSSERKDFNDQRTISYDFDGDGTWDMTTKDSKVEYVYKEPWNFTPRVKVTYRWYSGIARWDKITVEKWLRAGFLSAIVGKTLIIRDTSYGNDINSRKFCADVTQCRTNENRLVENQTYFKKEYPAAGKYVTKYDITDSNGNTSTAWMKIIEIKDSPDAIWIVTLPGPSSDGSVPIGKSLDNKVLFYVDYPGGEECFIDTDISKDSDWSWTPDQNRNINCNVVTLYEYKDPSVSSTIARVYYSDWTWLATKDISIKFLDFNVELPEKQKEVYTLINDTIQLFSDQQSDFKSILLQLRNNVLAGDDTSALVLDLKSAYDQKRNDLSAQQQENIGLIIQKLSDATTISVLWWNTYEIAKGSILSTMPTARKAEVEGLFEQIENANGNQDLIRTNLNEIIIIGTDEYNKENLDQVDMDEVQKQVCKIINYYEISGTTCSTATSTDTMPIPTDTEQGGKTILGWVLKRVLIIVWIIWVAFVALVVVFAIKAKKKQESGAEE